MPVNLGALVARILLAALFVEAGWSALGNIAGTASYFSGLGLPLPNIVAWVAGLFEFVAGLCLLLGFVTRPAALLLAVYAIAAALLGHYGQSQGDGAMAFMHWQAFMKDIAVSGGLVALAVAGAGAFSIDARLRR